MRADFLFLFGLAALSERDFSFVIDDAVSSRSSDGRSPIALALRVAFGDEFSFEGP